jgi:hypothetical protein
MNNDTKTDFQTYHIQGYAAAVYDEGSPESSHFDVPLISHIEGNLWMGGCINGVRLDDDFKHVVSLYPWEQYALGPNTKRIEFRLYDGAEIPDERTLGSVVRYTNRCLEDGKTLVHCFPPGTLVGGLTPSPIESATEVLGHDGLIHKVTYHHKNEYDGPMHTLKSVGALDILCTPEHPVQIVRPYIFSGGVVAKPGMPSYEHVSTVRAHYGQQPVWVDAKDVVAGDFLVAPALDTTQFEATPQVWPKFSNDARLKPIGDLIPDADTAWMLGFFAADGGTMGENSISFTLSPKDDLGRLLRVWERMGVVPTTIHHDNYVRVIVASRTVSAAMRVWFGKGDEKRLPEFLFAGWPLISVVEGYVDGDGYRKPESATTCHTISRTLAEQVRMILVSLGEFPTVSLAPRHSGYDNAKQGYNIQWNPRATQHQTDRWRGLYLMPVRSNTTEHYVGTVYNLAVADAETYTVNGALVHNCQAGLNRSGLISALSLIERGWLPGHAIQLLRAKRHDLVLCNKSFEKYLRKQTPAAA